MHSDTFLSGLMAGIPIGAILALIVVNIMIKIMR